MVLVDLCSGLFKGLGNTFGKGLCSVLYCIIPTIISFVIGSLLIRGGVRDIDFEKEYSGYFIKTNELFFQTIQQQYYTMSLNDCTQINSTREMYYCNQIEGNQTLLNNSINQSINQCISIGKCLNEINQNCKPCNNICTSKCNSYNMYTCSKQAYFSSCRVEFYPYKLICGEINNNLETVCKKDCSDFVCTGYNINCGCSNSICTLRDTNNICNITKTLMLNINKYYGYYYNGIKYSSRVVFDNCNINDISCIERSINKTLSQDNSKILYFDIRSPQYLLNPNESGWNLTSDYIMIGFGSFFIILPFLIYLLCLLCLICRRK